MRWLPLLLGILLILVGLLHQQRSQAVVSSFMRTDQGTRSAEARAPYDMLPLEQKKEWEATRVHEMEELDDPAPLNAFQTARGERTKGRIVVWAGFCVTLLSLLLVQVTKPRRH